MITDTFDDDLKTHLQKFGWNPNRRIDVSEWTTKLSAEGLTNIPQFIEDLWAELGNLVITDGDHPNRLNRDRWLSWGCPHSTMVVDPVAATRNAGGESVSDLIERSHSYGKRLFPFASHVESFSTMVFSESGEFIDVANSQFDIWGETPNQGLKNWLFLLCYSK